MKISQLLVESRVVADCQETDKGKLLQRLAEMFARDLPGASSAELLSLLLERERAASTGIGEGLAVPHARLSLTAPGGKWLSTPMAALLRVESGLAFEARDGQPVHLVMGLISTLENREDHLRALSACARLLHNPASRARMLAAQNRETLYRIALGGQEDASP